MSEALSATSDPDNTSDPIVKEAQKRFKRCMDWESNARKLFMDDLKFFNADSDNGYQWPNAIRRNRDIDEKPCLTVNKTRQHCLQIINDGKKNKPGIKLMPTGNGATKESADCLSSLIRQIEYQSKATVAYDTASYFQVACGIGYLRVVTEYSDEGSMNQELYIRRVSDPLTVYLDPDAKELDKSDMQYAFVFDDIPIEMFEEMYPEWKDKVGIAALGNEQDWVQAEKVRTAEYFRIVEEKDTLFHHGGRYYKKSDLLNPAHYDMAKQAAETDGIPFTEREIKNRKVEYYFIVGHEVVEQKTFPGKYIPLVPVIGEETVIEGLMDRKGHVRALKDCQRMYNYWSSSAVEYGALQTKTPWIAPVEAIEGYEEYWRDANRTNPSILPYNAVREDGTDIPPPNRIDPPVPAPVSLEGMKIAAAEMEMVSGQYAAQMGEPSNERTGKAIQERQRQADTATYHYVDGLAVSIRHLGRILLDLIPLIYDTKRLIKVMGEDQQPFDLQIDPQQQKTLVQHMNAQNQIALRSLNPAIGLYNVHAEVGPGWATKREEAFNAFTLILTQAPELVNLVGDILFQAGDFPFADQAASRLRRMVPKQALGEGPSPQEQQMQLQIQNLSQLLTRTIDELATERLKVKGKAAQKEIDVYKAYTDRLDVILKSSTDMETLKQAAIGLIHEMSQTNLENVTQTSEQDLGQPQQGAPLPSQAKMPPNVPQPPVPGAIMKPDGNWWLPDPTRLGRDRMIGPGPEQGPTQAPDGQWYSKRPDGGFQLHPKKWKAMAQERAEGPGGQPGVGQVRPRPGGPPVRAPDGNEYVHKPHAGGQYQRVVRGGKRKRK